MSTQPTKSQWKAILAKLDQARADFEMHIQNAQGLLEDWEPRADSPAEEKKGEIESAIDTAGQMALDEMQNAIGEIASAAGIDW